MLEKGVLQSEQLPFELTDVLNVGWYLHARAPASELVDEIGA
jgi:hypothetical protein